MTYIDITDFLLYVRTQVKSKSPIIPTGIQRVVLEFAMNGILLNEAQCIYYSQLKGKYMHIPNDIMIGP